MQFAQPLANVPRSQITQLNSRSDAKAELRKVKAQQRQRRAEQKAAEKRTKEQEKAQRRALVQQAKQEKLLEYLRALASLHPRQNIKRIRYNHYKEDYVVQQYHMPIPNGNRYAPVSPESWLESERGVSHDLVSPVASPAPHSPYHPQRSLSPPSIPRWTDFANKDELWDHLRGERTQVNGSAHRPQELPAYERIPLDQPRAPAAICEAPTDLPDRDLQTCKPKPNLVYCDICSVTVSLSGVFYSCSTCGPREGGIVCSGCHQENRKCHGGLHDLESSMQVVKRFSPASAWGVLETQQNVDDGYPKGSEQSEDSVALSRISAETASHTLCLASMQKKMTKVESCIETQNKTTEGLASWLEEAMERQREQAVDLTRSMLEEFRAERIANMKHDQATVHQAKAAAAVFGRLDPSCWFIKRPIQRARDGIS